MLTTDSKNSGKQSTQPAILLLGSRMELGSRQRSLLDQTRWFYQGGHRVVLAFLYDAEGLYAYWQSKVPVPLGNLKAYVPGGMGLANAFRGAGGMVSVAQMVAIGEFDALLACGPGAALMGLPLAWLGNVRTRIAIYTDRPANPRLYAGLINKLARWLVVDSLRDGEEAISLGILPEKIVHVPPGISPAEETNPHPYRTRWDLDFSEDCLLVVVTGSMGARSGYHSLLRAISLVHQRAPGAGFVLLGEGSLRPGFIEEARKTGISDYVRFPDASMPEGRMLAAADLYLALPGSGQAVYHLLKAQSLGKPVIAVNVEGAGEIIEHGVNGLLVPPDNEGALTEALAQLLEDGRLRDRLAAEGQARVRQEYNLDRMCSAYAALLDPAFSLEVG